MESRKFGITVFPAARLKANMKRADGTPCDGTEDGDVWWPNEGKLEEHDLESLFDRLSTARDGKTKYLVPFFIGARLKGGKKTKRDHQGSSCLTVDVDDAGLPPEDVSSAFSDVAHLLYTTYQHTPDSPRSRIIIPLSRDVTYKEYEAVWTWANERLGERSDPKAKDGVRACFWYSGRKNGRYILNDEAPLLDVEAVLADYAEPAVTAGMLGSTKPQPEKPLPKLRAKKDHLDPAQVLSGIPEGGRDNALFRYACQLRARDLRQEEAEVLIVQAARACSPPFDEEIAKNKVRNVWNTYAPGKTDGREDASVAEAAAGVLSEVEREVRTAGTREERIEAISQLLDDGASVAIGIAYRENPSTVIAALQRMGAVRGCAQAAQQVLARAKASAKEQERKRKEERRAAFRVVGPDEDGDPIDEILSGILEDHDIPERLYCPKDWIINKSGINRLSYGEDGRVDEVEVCACPVIVTGRLVDVDDGTASLRVEWYRKGEWIHRVVPREHVMDARSLVALSKYDFPVDSNSAKDIVAYLSAFEAENIRRIPTAKVASRMGWQGPRGRYGFLWGRTLLRAGEETSEPVALENAPPTEWREDWIHLHTNDSGQSQLIDGYRAAGTPDGWLEAYNLVLRYPRVLIALYAALVPPLLDIIPDAPNFIIDYAGATSRGKTTTMRVAASVWGVPDEREDGVIHTWDATRVWIERAAQMVTGLPLILDDTKKANDTKQVGKVLYDVASGRGRGRGNPGGLRQTSRWRTVLLSTGEAPATSFTNDGGSRARTLVFWGSPFGGTSGDTPSDVRSITRAVMRNYGHLGPAVIRQLVAAREDWPDLREKYLDNLDGWLDRAGNDPVAGRVAQYMALLQLAGHVLHDQLGFERPKVDPFEEAWRAGISAAGDSDRAVAAIMEVYSWAVANQTGFYGRHEMYDERPRQPPGGWLGYWPKGDAWPHIGIIPRTLRDMLSKASYDFEAVAATWNERGYLVRGDKSAHRTWFCNINGAPERCYCIKREVFEAVLGIHEQRATHEEPPPPEREPYEEEEIPQWEPI